MKRIIFLIVVLLSINKVVYSQDVSKSGVVQGIQNHLLPVLSSNQYFLWNGSAWIATTPLQLNTLSASTPLSYNNSTGAFSIQVANTSQNGYLSSTDWNRFNNTVSSPWVNYTSGIYYPNDALIGSSVAPTTSTVLNTIETSTNAQRGVSFYQYNNGANSSEINFLKSRGTVGSPSTIVTTDIISDLKSWAYDGTQFTNCGSAKWTSTGTISNANIPTVFTVSTMNATGVLTNGLTIDQLQNTTVAGNLAYTGSITTGVLGYTDTGILGALQGSSNSYQQFIVENTNSGTSASSDFVVNNNQSTATTNYGDFGMNSSGWVGSGAFNTANNVYLTSTTVDLAIGTMTSNAIHFVVNNGATDAMTISSAGALTVNNAAKFNSTFTGNTINSLGAGFTFTADNTTGTNASGNISTWNLGLGTSTGASSTLAIYPSIPSSTSGTTAQTYPANPLVFGAYNTGGAAYSYGLFFNTSATSISNSSPQVSFNPSTTIMDISLTTGGLLISGGAVTITNQNLSVGNGTLVTNTQVQSPVFASHSANVTFKGDDNTGTNTTGFNANLSAGKGTGNATPSSVFINAPNTTTSGATAQTLSVIGSFDAVNGSIFRAINTTQPALLARGFGVAGSYTQTADLFKAQSFNGTTATDIARIDNNGNFYSQTLITTSATPGIAAGAGAGTAPTIAISGTNNSGKITITTGTTPSGAGAVIATITLSNSFAFPNQITPEIRPANSTANSLVTGVSGTTPFASSSTTSTWVINAGALGLAAATTYIFYYTALGN